MRKHQGRRNEPGKEASRRKKVMKKAGRRRRGRSGGGGHCSCVFVWSNKTTFVILGLIFDHVVSPKSDDVTKTCYFV